MKPTPSLSFARVLRSRIMAAVYTLALVFGISGTALAGGLNSGGAMFVTLSNQNSAATSVTYTYTLRPATTGTAIKCFKLQTQTPQGTNALPSGMSLSSAAGGTTTGLGGLTYTADTTGAASGLIKYTNATGSTPTNPITLAMTSITNSNTNGTYYFAINTYGNTDCSTTPLDNDTVAFVIADSTVTVTANVGETLTFSLSTTSVSLGTLSTGSVSTGTGNLTVSTNATNGYGINAKGVTLTSGANTIPFVTDGTPVAAGTSGFGIRITTCAGGATCSNTQDIGSGLVSGLTGIITRSSPTNGDTSTITYRSSISATQQAGNYTGTVSYVAVGQF